MDADIAQRFLAAPTHERLELARDNAHAAALRAYLGEAAYAEYRALAEAAHRALSQRHLGTKAPTNLLFVPGLMGSLLFSQTLGGAWWIDVRTRHHLNDLRLAPDGRADANADHRLVPLTTDISYEPFLQAVLLRDDFGHDVLPYDWRKPLSSGATSLRDKVAAIHATNGGRPVHIVAHSMGGLLVRVALLEHGADLWPRLGRIVFIGTPHYGSPAIAGYLKNHLWGFELLVLLARYLSRDTFRSLWGALSMLPAPRSIYPGTRSADTSLWHSGEQKGSYEHPCANFDLYDTSSWKLDLTPEQDAHLQTVLGAAADSHRRLYEAHLRLNQELRNRMAVIVGVGMRTLFRVAYRNRLWLWEHMYKEFGRVPGDPHREGDGRVPVASGCLEHVGAVRYVQGVHGELPNIPAVYNDVFRWLRGEPLALPTSPKAALGHHLGGLPTESVAPHLDGSALASRSTGDPGYWQLSDPAPARLAELEDELRQEQLPEFNRVHLM